MADAIGDHEAIAAVVGRYIDGASAGDVSLLRAAFHPEARMFGAAGGTRVDLAMEPFFALSAAHPLTSAGNDRAGVIRRSNSGTPRWRWSSRTAAGAACPSSISCRCRGSMGPGGSSTSPSPIPAERSPHYSTQRFVTRSTRRFVKRECHSPVIARPCRASTIMGAGRIEPRPCEIAQRTSNGTPIASSVTKKISPKIAPSFQNCAGGM